MSKCFIVLLALLSVAAPALSDSPQSDWSGGPGGAPTTEWTDNFANAADISWRAVPGQVALAGNALGTAVEHKFATFIQGAFGVEVADIDHDGDQDIIGVAENARRVTIWYNDGLEPPTLTPEIIDSNYLAVAAVVAVDLNGDQLLDLVTSSGSVLGQVNCYLNQGGSPAVWVERSIDPQWGEAWEIGTADVDNDGHMDVLGTSLTMDSVVWWRNDGLEPIGWTRMIVDAAFDVAHSARGADLDGDGHTDIFGCGTSSNEVAWWRNSGTTPITWTKTVLDSTFSGGRSVRSADIDNDGDPDLAAVGFNGRVKWWRNDGGSPIAWTAQVADSTMAALHQLQIADVNGDGHLDFIAADYLGNALAWWQNGGGPAPVWTRYRSMNSINRPLAVAVGDVDGDGAVEIVGSSNGVGKYSWYDVTTFASSGALTSAVLDRGVAADGNITWNADTPVGTDVRFRVRSGPDPAALGDWSEEITGPGPMGTLGRYVQYEALLSTGSSDISPVLLDITVTSPVSSVLPEVRRGALRTFPNPANPRVMVAYDLPRGGQARLDVFDSRGRRLRTLLDGEQAPGAGQVSWNGTDDSGRAMATGIYFLRFSTPSGHQRARIALVR